MSGLYLFTGENVYALRQEKMRWIRQFVEKYGEENLVRLEGGNTAFRTLLDEVSTAPFIAPKRLVIVDGMPKCAKEEVELLLQNIHPDVLVLIADAKPDKRLGGTKEVLRVADVKEFKPLALPVLQQWMEGVARENDVTIDRPAIAMLLELVGQDQDLLETELQRLALRKRSISAADVEETVSPTDEGVVWKLTDMLAAGKRTEAVLYAHRSLERGGDAHGLWAILLHLLKNAIAIAAETESGNTNQKDIAEHTGVHPFAVRSLFPHAKAQGTKGFSALLQWAVETDKSLKTGGYRATDEAPEELLAIIDRFLLLYPVTASRSA